MRSPHPSPRKLYCQGNPWSRRKNPTTAEGALSQESVERDLLRRQI